MSSITSILNIATSALFASQTCLQVTSNNVANADTVGYIRQTAVLNESASINSSSGLLGTGVTVTAIEAIYDQYLEASVAEENNASEEWSVYEAYFSRIETILSEDNTSLSANITDFSMPGDAVNGPDKQHRAPGRRNGSGESGPDHSKRLHRTERPPDRA
jgi:flagellar hook-associated protein 1 FlgK